MAKKETTSPKIILKHCHFNKSSLPQWNPWCGLFPSAASQLFVHKLDEGFNIALHLGICSRKQRCRDKEYRKKVKLYNCICNYIPVSTSLLYPLQLYVVMVEKNHYEHEKRHNKSQISVSPFFLHSVSVQQFVSNLVPKRNHRGRV